MDCLSCEESLSPLRNSPSLDLSAKSSSSNLSECYWTNGPLVKSDKDALLAVLRENIAKEKPIARGPGDTGLYSDFRVAVMRNIVTYCDEAQYTPETKALAISILDTFVYGVLANKFLGDREMPVWDSVWMTSLVTVGGIASLQLAAKYNEVQYRPLLYTIVAFFPHLVAAFPSLSLGSSPADAQAAQKELTETKAICLQYEKAILNFTGYNPYPTSPTATLETICEILACDNTLFGASSLQELTRLATSILTDEMAEGSHLELAPSAFATAAVVAAGVRLQGAGRCDEATLQATVRALARVLPEAVYDAAVLAPFLPYMPALARPSAVTPVALRSPVHMALSGVDGASDSPSGPSYPWSITSSPEPEAGFEDPMLSEAPALRLPAFREPHLQSQRALFRASSASALEHHRARNLAAANKTRFASEPGATFPPAAGRKRKFSTEAVSRAFPQVSEEEEAELNLAKVHLPQPSPLGLPRGYGVQLDVVEVPEEERAFRNVRASLPVKLMANRLGGN